VNQKLPEYETGVLAIHPRPSVEIAGFCMNNNEPSSIKMSESDNFCKIPVLQALISLWFYMHHKQEVRNVCWLVPSSVFS
jgi:hypothetical protein